MALVPVPAGLLNVRTGSCPERAAACPACVAYANLAFLFHHGRKKWRMHCQNNTVMADLVKVKACGGVLRQVPVCRAPCLQQTYSRPFGTCLPIGLVQNRGPFHSLASILHCLFRREDTTVHGFRGRSHRGLQKFESNGCVFG